MTHNLGYNLQKASGRVTSKGHIIKYLSSFNNSFNQFIQIRVMWNLESICQIINKKPQFQFHKT